MKNPLAILLLLLSCVSYQSVFQGEWFNDSKVREVFSEASVTRYRVKVFKGEDGWLIERWTEEATFVGVVMTSETRDPGRESGIYSVKEAVDKGYLIRYWDSITFMFEPGSDNRVYKIENPWFGDSYYETMVYNRKSGKREPVKTTISLLEKDILLIGTEKWYRYKDQ